MLRLLPLLGQCRLGLMQRLQHLPLRSSLRLRRELASELRLPRLGQLAL